MRDSVRNAFSSFNLRFEGRVAWMYLDIKGLVTIGVGNLIDPVSTALGLPFAHKDDGAAASTDEITAEWNLLKSQPGLAQKGYKACEAITRLRLSESAIDDLVTAKLEANERFIAKSFSDWEQWPADAQLGVLSMSWALGAGFVGGWPQFAAACKRRDWSAAAANCHIDETNNAGVKPRNEADVLLFNNAAKVEANGLDGGTLFYPGEASDSAPDGGDGNGDGGGDTSEDEAAGP